ncbi:putative quinol monooxygenase [Streptomyces roseus]|uniref:putative quinol monooxygenase n=1 Tax=Streptomyces roseus TaxID=66430 RepID=UPI00382610B3
MHADRGGELAAALLRVAETLHGFPGCEIYLISQDAADSDKVHVTEVWREDARARAALAAPSLATFPPRQTSSGCRQPRPVAWTSAFWAVWVSPPTTSPDEQAAARRNGPEAGARAYGRRGVLRSATLGPGTVDAAVHFGPSGNRRSRTSAR